VVQHRPKRTRDAAVVLRLVNDRPNLLAADKVVEEAALDKYSYIRDAYLQRRRNLIHDGNPPREVEADADQVDRPMRADTDADAPRADAGPAVLPPTVIAARMEPADVKQ